MLVNLTENRNASASQPSPRTIGRVTSIDALRGFTMFWIIGGGYIVHNILKLILAPLPYAIDKHFEHAKWIGFNGWDLIMPLFLFISGTSLPFAMSRRILEQSNRRDIYIFILKRSAILFILGIIVQGNLLKFDLSVLHLFCNTLQAISCGYLVASIALLNLNTAWQAVISILLLVGYWLLMVMVPVSGHISGIIDPNLNLALHIDEVVLGRFRDGKTYTWILSSMTFSSTVILGMMSGHILKSRLLPKRKFLTLVLVGFICIAAGNIVGIWFPVIKHIWSSSFVLIAAGISFLLQAIFYYIIDISNLRKWSFFFVVIGSNSIFVYCLTMVTNDYVESLAGQAYNQAGTIVATLIVIIFFALLWLLLYIMYKRNIFIKV